MWAENVSAEEKFNLNVFMLQLYICRGLIVCFSPFRTLCWCSSSVQIQKPPGPKTSGSSPSMWFWTVLFFLFIFIFIEMLFFCFCLLFCYLVSWSFLCLRCKLCFKGAVLIKFWWWLTWISVQTPVCVCVCVCLKCFGLLKTSIISLSSNFAPSSEPRSGRTASILSIRCPAVSQSRHCLWVAQAVDWTSHWLAAGSHVESVLRRLAGAGFGTN